MLRQPGKSPNRPLADVSRTPKGPGEKLPLNRGMVQNHPECHIDPGRNAPRRSAVGVRFPLRCRTALRRVDDHTGSAWPGRQACRQQPKHPATLPGPRLPPVCGVYPLSTALCAMPATPNRALTPAHDRNGQTGETAARRLQAGSGENIAAHSFVFSPALADRDPITGSVACYRRRRLAAPPHRPHRTSFASFPASEPDLYHPAPHTQVSAMNVSFMAGERVPFSWLRPALKERTAHAGTR